MHRALKVLLLLGFVVCVSPRASLAVPFVNGDFAGGLAGWNAVPDNGSVVAAGGAAELDTGPGVSPFSAILLQGDDGAFTFSPPLSLGASDFFLVFDVAFFDLGADGSESTGLFTDSLAVVVYDALDPALDLVFADVAALFDPGPRQVVLDVSPLVGRDVALSFELSDEDDGRDSRVRLDNVFFTDTPPATVAEPGSLALLFGGAGLLLARRRRARQR